MNCDSPLNVIGSDVRRQPNQSKDPTAARISIGREKFSRTYLLGFTNGLMGPFYGLSS